MAELRDKKGLTEAEFLRQYDPDKYPKPAVTVDIVVFRARGEAMEVLLVRRGGHPFLGYWALPGGFAEKNETLEMSAARELMEETGVTDVPLRLVGVYSRPGRDPRGWTVSAAYAAVIRDDRTASAGDDASAVQWAPLERTTDGGWRLDTAGLSGSSGETGRLAFDHSEILADAIECCREEMTPA